MPSVIGSSLLQVRLTIARRSPSCRIVGQRRYPLAKRTFHAAACLRHPSDSTDSSAAVRSAHDHSKQVDIGAQLPSAGGSKDTQSENLKFYGSARRRSMRNGRLRLSDESLPVSLPQSFLHEKVVLLSDNDGVSLVQPVPAHVDSQPAQSHTEGGDAPGSSGPDSGSSEVGKGDTSTLEVPHNPEYEVPADVWTELDLSVKAGLRPPRPEAQDAPRREKCHIIVNAICESGQRFVQESIKQLAKQHEADMLVLDAIDIGRIAADHHHGNTEIKGLSDLGFQVYKEDEFTSENESFVDDEAEESIDMGDADSGPMPPVEPLAFPSKKPLKIATSVHFNLSDALGPLFQKFNNRQSASPSDGIFIAQMDDHAKSFSEQRDARVWGAFIDQILQAPTAKSSNVQEKTSTEDSSTSKRLIVVLQDIMKIAQVRGGERFLGRLVKAVEEKRRTGQSILLVGSKSTELEVFKQMSMELDGMFEDVEVWQMVTLPPVMRHASARSTLWSDKRRWYRQVNEVQLMDALRAKKSGHLPQPVDGAVFTASPEPDDKLPLILITKFKVEERYLSSSQINRMATFIAGNDTTDPDQPFVASEVRIALDKLWKSDAARAVWMNQESRKEREMTGSFETPHEDKIKQIAKSCTRHERKLLGGVVEPDKIRTTFGDVHVPIETVQSLKTLTTLSLVRRDAFSYGVLASDKIPGLLLYGPPGTGKTLLAKAVAKESGARVLEVSGAEINDMYVGESEKNIKALFSLAKKLTPCVIFIDEADAMFSSRTQSRQRTAHREMINQFLREWDGMANDSGGAFIMVATNRPFDLDDAVLRRLPRRLLVDLPGEQDRLEILKIHLKDESLAEKVDLQQLATNTPFYSGSDLKNLAVAAALNAVTEENELAKQHVGDEPYVYPPRRTLQQNHFDKAMEEITASISDDMDTLKAIKKFDEQFGDRRGRKKKAPKWGFHTTAEADKVLDTVKVRE